MQNNSIGNFGVFSAIFADISYLIRKNGKKRENYGVVKK